MMPRHRIFTTEFAKVYPMYVQKGERKHRTKEEVGLLTGYIYPRRVFLGLSAIRRVASACVRRARPGT